MTPEAADLIHRWRLPELRTSQVLFLTGAGISGPPPTSFPLGRRLHEVLLANYSSLTPSEVCTLARLDTWTLERTCDVIFQAYREWQPHAVVNWFWNLLSEIFIYRPGVAWAQPNDLHAYFRKHIDLGGRHFTANLDQFIELAWPPYYILTTCMLESAGVPLNVANVVDEPILYKFHGDCNIDAVHLQGVLHRVIEDGFQANTRRYWSEVLRSVDLVVVCGYGGFDNFDVNRYFEELDEGAFRAKAVWIDFRSGMDLTVVPNTAMHAAASRMLSRFAESVVLNGEPNGLLNVLFSGSLPPVHRHPPGPHAPQYNDIFRINIEHASATPGFQGCLENITQRLRGTLHRLYALTAEEHARAREIAYGLAEGRGSGQLPPYDPMAAVDDFCRAAGEVIAHRVCP